jgi:shikimate kinase
VNVKQIYLMGMKNTGKTVHGMALAKALGRSFCDIDSLVQEIDSTETGMRRTVRDIYTEDGPDRFRQLEAAACRLAAERDVEQVVATGGGICDNEEALAATTAGLRVHLLDAHDAIAVRVFRRGIPAFLHTRSVAVARERFRELYDRRVAAYIAVADLTVDLTNRTLSEARAEIINTLEEHLGRQ